MLKKLATLFCVTFVLTGYAKAEVSVPTYIWANTDAKASLQLPKVDSADLQKEIYSRIQKAADSFFQVTLYLPQEENDPKFSKDMDALYAKAKEESAKIPVPGDVFDYTIKTQVLANTENLVSLKLEFDSSVKGMAHPASSGMFINYDPKTGKFMDSLSFLSPEEQQKVFEKVQSTLEEKLKDSLYTKGEKLKALLTNHFGIQNSTLVFYFWPYEVAPYVYGPQTLNVPYAAAE